VCVWQECQNVVQLCTRKKNKASVEEEMATLDGVKVKLIKSVEKEDAKGIARCIIECKQLYLLLHAKRMLTFIQYPRSIEQLKTTCASLRRINLESQTTARSKLVLLKHYNETLTTGFSLQQRENIVDFLRHLDDFFRPNVRTELGIKKWMLCTRDHVFGVTDDSVPDGQLEEQCFECFPENKITTDASNYDEDIDTVIGKLLDKPSAKSLDVLLRELGISRSYSSDEDSFDVPMDDDFDLY
jgi:hypothetical protein